MLTWVKVKVNMSIESEYITSNLRDICSLNAHDHDPDLPNGSISNVNMLIQSAYMTSYLPVVAQFATSVAI